MTKLPKITPHVMLCAIHAWPLGFSLSFYFDFYNFPDSFHFYEAYRFLPRSYVTVFFSRSICLISEGKKT